ncbi:MAG: hypothetical protein L0I24_10885 [Pseudonocardia sp.]|nr:hypothetical protein [Pseudonocardia sp.]
MSSAEQSRQPDAAVLDGVVQRLAGEIAQARVTIAELDVRLQMQTAQVVRLEADLAKRPAPAEGPDPEGTP